MYLINKTNFTLKNKVNLNIVKIYSKLFYYENLFYRLFLIIYKGDFT